MGTPRAHRRIIGRMRAGRFEGDERRADLIISIDLSLPSMHGAPDLTIKLD